MTTSIDDIVAEASTSLVQDIANAPGTLPAPEVEARYRALERQFRHDNTIVPLAPRPGLPTTIIATSGAGVRLERATIYYTLDGSTPSAASERVEMAVGGVDWDVRTGYLTRWQGEIPTQPAGTIVRYRIGGWPSGWTGEEPPMWAQDGSGFWFRYPPATGITTFAFSVEEPRAALPGWMADAVIYHIFLDRFHPGGQNGEFTGDLTPRGMHGGTLAGVQQALPYLSDLGVTCLWLSPLHPAETHHRYDTMDYFDVDPRLGTREEFKALVDEAHERGMKVLLDFVPSHSSWHHPAFLAAQADRDAPTASWFTFYEWPHRYRSFLDMSNYLPSWNTNDPGARAHLIESAVYWIREFGVDGYRLDHAIAPSMDFWTAFYRAIEETSPEAATIGEATDTPDFLRRYRGRLHGILDFELAAALRLTFGRGDWGVAALDNLITSYDRFMADGPGRVSFLDNHDMDRFLWVAGNDTERLRLAALCQFTLAPTPVVYYGTEIGMTQESGSDEVGFGGDAEARRDMLWDINRWNHELLTFYRGLTRLRREHPVLGRGGRRTVHLDSQRQSWAYLRTAGDSPVAGDLLVVFNLADSEARIQLPPELGEMKLRCLLSTGAEPSCGVRAGRSMVLLAPCTGAVLQLS